MRRPGTASRHARTRTPAHPPRPPSDGGPRPDPSHARPGPVRLAGGPERRPPEASVEIVVRTSRKRTRSRPEDLAGDYPALQPVPPHGDDPPDLPSRLGEAFRFESLESGVIVVDGIRLRGATPAMLYRLKKDTVRPQDPVDAEALRTQFGLDQDV